MRTLGIIIIMVFTIMYSQALFAKQDPLQHKPGDTLPTIVLKSQLLTEEVSYLGIPAPVSSEQALRISDISAEIIIIEFLNTHCTSCRAQAPLMNKVYTNIGKNPAFKNKVKIIGIAAGNSPREVARFRQERGILFPIIADPDFRAYDLIGEPGGTPYTLVVKKRANRLVVHYTHMGLFSSYADLLNHIEISLNRTTDTDAVKSHQTAATTDQATRRKLFLDITRAETKRLVTTSMLKGKDASAHCKIDNLKKIRLPDETSIYHAEKTYNNKKQSLFSKVITRKPVCDVCHGVHFIITFDSSGHITDFLPIHLTKYANLKWDEKDINVMRQKLEGKSIKISQAFDPDVDAVSTATMSSALIFNSVNKLHDIYRELQHNGYLK